MEHHPDSFRSSFRILLILGQICGLIPVQGIFGRNLIFTWSNPIHLYGFFISGVTAFFDVCYTMDNLKTKFGIDNFGKKKFCTCTELCRPVQDMKSSIVQGLKLSILYLYRTLFYPLLSHLLASPVDNHVPKTLKASASLISSTCYSDVFSSFFTAEDASRQLPKLARSDPTSTVFYTVCLLTSLFFLQIAIRFPETSAHFERIEKSMADFGYPRGLGFKIKLFLCVFVLLAVVEHGTMITINVTDVWSISSETGEDFGPLFYATRFPPVSRRLSYSGWTFFFLLWVNVICTFNWNYIDFFLISLSLQISTRFALINKRLTTNSIQNRNSKFFMKITKHYNQLSLLTKKMDKAMGNIILISFFSNLYHISLQLVRSLKLGGSLFQRIYFYFSLIYLIARLLLVLFFASKIHEQSKKPASILFSLDHLPPEAIRFLHQVLTDEIAFTGSKFFAITRKFVMSVMGTIVTYQAFLLQFNSLNQQ